MAFSSPILLSNTSYPGQQQQVLRQAWPSTCKGSTDCVQTFLSASNSISSGFKSMQPNVIDFFLGMLTIFDSLSKYRKKYRTVPIYFDRNIECQRYDIMSKNIKIFRYFYRNCRSSLPYYNLLQFLLKIC